MLSVDNSCHYNETPKNCKNRFWTKMSFPQELSHQIPARRAKARMQKLGCKSPRVGENFWCKSPGVRGGMVMTKIDSCIIFCMEIPEKELFYSLSTLILDWIKLSRMKSIIQKGLIPARTQSQDKTFSN